MGPVLIWLRCLIWVRRRLMSCPGPSSQFDELLLGKICSYVVFTLVNMRLVFAPPLHPSTKGGEHTVRYVSVDVLPLMRCR